MNSFVKIGEEVIRVAGVDVQFELQRQMGTQNHGSVRLIGVIERVNGSAVVLIFLGPSDGIDRVGMRKFLDSIPVLSK